MNPSRSTHFSVHSTNSSFSRHVSFTGKLPKQHSPNRYPHSSPSSRPPYITPTTSLIRPNVENCRSGTTLIPASLLSMR